MLKKLSRKAWIAIAVIALIVIGGGAVSANHTMQVNHQKKVAADKLKAEKKNTKALANHVVVNGDTVQSVAKKFKENTNYMKKKLNLSKDDQLIVGTKIIDQRAAIDKKKQDDANAAAAASAAQAAAQSQVSDKSGNGPTSNTTSSSSEFVQGRAPVAQTPTQSNPVVQTPAGNNRQYADKNSGDVANMNPNDQWNALFGSGGSK